MMKVLIIGSKGFIGASCAKFFELQGKEVFCADVVPSSKNNFFLLDKTHTDFSNLFSNSNFDVCINASGSASVDFSFDNPAIDFELNVLNVQKLLVQIRQNCPGCKFINFSSAAVYGNPLSLPISETERTLPLSPYGFHKLQAESLLSEYNSFFNLNTCSLRIFSVFGPGLKKQIFWDMHQKMIVEDEVHLFGDGNEGRDFIYIDDLLVAISCVIKNARFKGEVINVANGHQIRIKVIARLFYDEFNFKAFQFSGEKHIGNPNNWEADISSLKSLGYQNTISIEEGIKKYVTWLSEK
jgi:UDP-glucose 4-epimerase